MEEIEITGHIWDMKDGKTTAINVDGEIFRLEGTDKVGGNKPENPSPKGKKETYLHKWIRKNNIESFTLDDFYKAYPKQKERRKQRKLIEKYISEMIANNELLQMGNDTFKVTKNIF